MIIRRAALAATLFAATPAFAAPINPGVDCIETPANAEGFTLAREIIEIALPAEQADQMFGQMIQAFNNSMKSLLLDEDSTSDPGVIAIRDEYLNSVPGRVAKLMTKSLPEMKAAQACAYTHMFSLDELRQINGFAKTPAGTHFFQAGVQVMADPAVNAWMQSYMKDARVMMSAMAEDMKTELAEYESAKKKRGKSN